MRDSSISMAFLGVTTVDFVVNTQTATSYLQCSSKGSNPNFLIMAFFIAPAQESCERQETGYPTIVPDQLAFC